MHKKIFFHNWIGLFFALVFYFYEYVLRVSSSVMTENLMVDFHVTASSLGVLISCYYMAYVPLQIPCGIIVDKIGIKKVITVSAILCLIGSYIFSKSNYLLYAQIGRFMIGAGSACAYISCIKASSEWFDHKKFALLSGITMFMGTLGGTFGAKPFAILVNKYGWRSSMEIFSIIGIFVAICSWFFIKDIKVNKHNAFESLSVMKSLKIIVTNKQNWIIALYGCLMYLPLTAFAELWGTPFLMKLYNINNEKASIGSVVVFVGVGIGSILSALLVKIFKSVKKILSLSAVLTCAIFSVVFFADQIAFVQKIVLLFLGGVASGLQVLYLAAAKDLNPQNIQGTVFGFTNCGIMASGIIFQPVLGFILDLTWNKTLNPDGSRYYSILNYKQSFIFVSLLIFIAFLLSIFIKETYQVDRKT